MIAPGTAPDAAVRCPADSMAAGRAREDCAQWWDSKGLQGGFGDFGHNAVRQPGAAGLQAPGRAGGVGKGRMDGFKEQMRTIREQALDFKDDG